jgi:RNA polymerase sigma-70 factor (ECF subfamily)
MEADAVVDDAKLRALLLKGLSGDEAAHREFLSEAAALLRRYFRSRLRGNMEDAEDLVQEALIALHTKRGSYDPAYPLSVWLYAIARYRMIDLIRRSKRREYAPIDDLELGDTDPAFEASDARRDVGMLLERLPDKQKHAIRLVKLEERSVREAAMTMGLSESDIKVSVHRGLKTLMRVVGEKQAAWGRSVLSFSPRCHAAGASHRTPTGISNWRELRLTLDHET